MEQPYDGKSTTEGVVLLDHEQPLIHKTLILGDEMTSKVVSQKSQISSPENLTKGTKLNISEDEIEEYEDEQFEYEYDDLIVEDTLEPILPPKSLPYFPVERRNTIIITDDPPFTEQDLEDFINYDPVIQEARPLTSEGSFHSMQNSIHSTSSFAMELGKLEMNQLEKLTSNSSKRKGIDGVDDTASSMVKDGKKRKNEAP